MKTMRIANWAVCLLALVAVAGCSNGDKKLTIQGTISYKGQPVRSGFLKFVGPKEGYTGASIQSDGTFIIAGVVPGENKIGVREAPRNSRLSPEEQKTPPVVLPEKFRDPETSGVVYTIAPNATELAIELK